MTGIIDLLKPEKGYGFIKGTDNKRYFFHASDLRGGAKFNELCGGDPVEFEDDDTPKGLRAVEVYLA